MKRKRVEEIEGEGAGPNHPVERTQHSQMFQNIETELDVLCQLGEPIVPFWDQSFFDPPPDREEWGGTQTEHRTHARVLTMSQRLLPTIQHVNPRTL